MTKQILFELTINGTEAEKKNLAELNRQIAELKEQVKEKNTADAQAREQAKLTLKEQQKNYRDLQKAVENRNKAEQKGADTLEKLRAQLSRYNKELEKIPLGTKEWDKQQKKINEVRLRIKDADESVGRFQAGVGNYRNAIVDAFQQMGINVQGFNNQLNQTSKLFSIAMPAGLGKTATALKILKLALVSTGIGAIVVVLGSIVAYLTSTQAGLDKINKILKPLGAVLQRTLGIAQQLGEALFLIVSGKFRQGWNQLKDTIASVGDQYEEAWKQGERLAEITIEIEQARLKLTQNEGKINRQLQEQRAILDDVNASAIERQAAGQKFLQLNEELTKLNEEIVKLEIEQLKLQQDQNDTNREGNIEEAAKIAELDELQAQRLGREREVRNKINTIIKQGNDEQLKAAIAYRQQYEQLLPVLRSIGDQLGLLQDREFELPDTGSEIYDAFANVYQEELAIIQDTTRQIQEGYNTRLEALRELLDAQLITEQDYAERKRQINSSIATDTINSLKGVAVEGSKIQQGLFLFEKLLSLREAFLNLQAGLAKTAGAAPFPANIPLLAGFIAQTAGLISAIKAVSAPKVPKFARGVIGLAGAGTGTSDSINADLSRGESVMTAAATSAFAPILADMERAVGNTPNYQIGAGRFAGGLIASQPQPRTAFAGSLDKIIEQTIRAIGSIPVVVSERDITNTQQRVRTIKVAGDL